MKGMSGKPGVGPLLRFVLIGLVLFCCRTLYTALSFGFASPSEHGARDAAQRDLLFRAARALGLDDQAVVVRERLVAVGQFLEIGASAGDQSVEREARGLGLEETDPIIRRHVEELADLALHQGGAAVLPSASEVEAYYASHRERFLDPARVSFVHVYFSGERRGSAALSAAQAALLRLRNDHLDVKVAGDWGDPFVAGASFRSVSASDLQRVFGHEFADVIQTLPAHGWSGPLTSPYGAHLVWIEHKSAARLRPLATVRNQIVHLLADQRREQLAAERLALIRQASLK